MSLTRNHIQALQFSICNLESISFGFLTITVLSMFSSINETKPNPQHHPPTQCSNITTKTCCLHSFAFTSIKFPISTSKNSNQTLVYPSCHSLPLSQSPHIIPDMPFKFHLTQIFCVTHLSRTEWHHSLVISKKFFWLKFYCDDNTVMTSTGYSMRQMNAKKGMNSNHTKYIHLFHFSS